MAVDISGKMQAVADQQNALLQEAIARATAQAQAAQLTAGQAASREATLMNQPPPEVGWQAAIPLFAAAVAQHFSGRPFAQQAIQMLQEHQQEITAQRAKALAMAHDSAQELAKMAAQAGQHADALKFSKQADSSAKQYEAILLQARGEQQMAQMQQRHDNAMAERAATQKVASNAVDEWTKVQLEAEKKTFEEKLKSLSDPLTGVRPDAKAIEALRAEHLANMATILGKGPPAPVEVPPVNAAPAAAETPETAAAKLFARYPGLKPLQILAIPGVRKALEKSGVKVADVARAMAPTVMGGGGIIPSTSAPRAKKTGFRSGGFVPAGAGSTDVFGPR